ncbi:uncharacterized protein LOC62_02G001864 [Vanrija pseudolonga]|uniref:Uncharacterized protein n=1 Tax=Vanrija pseudolonga TaxID=143232 RepID=A0AAF0Y2Q6_9TREE|nr:hypothetical protein LOC62_02G001864 [Vanrija pseudolonga]
MSGTLTIATLTPPPGPTGLSADTYSGLQPQLHSQCCATYSGQYNNLTLDQFNATAPPGLVLAPNISSAVIGRCHLDLVGPGRGNYMSYKTCLHPGSKAPADVVMWYAEVMNADDGTVWYLPDADGWKMVTLVTGRGTIAAPTDTNSYSVQVGDKFRAEYADFYSGLYFNQMSSCCDRLNGTLKFTSVEAYNLTAPIGLDLPTDLSSSNVGHCRIPSVRGDQLASCLDEVHTVPMWFIATQTDAWGTIWVWIKPGLTVTSTPWLDPTGPVSITGGGIIATLTPTAATTPTAPATRSAAGSSHAKLGLISLIGIAAAAVVLF